MTIKPKLQCSSKKTTSDIKKLRKNSCSLQFLKRKYQFQTNLTTDLWFLGIPFSDQMPFPFAYSICTNDTPYKY